MQFKIPQNVQREDTIIGPVTFKQLAILLVGGGISYSIYVLMAKSLYTNLTIAVFVAPIALLTLAIAFLKIKDMSFITALVFLTEYFIKPRTRFWKQGAGDVRLSVTNKLPEEVKSESKTEAELTGKNRRDKILELSKDLNQLSN